MRDASLDGEAIRIFLHVISVSVWLGGQIVVGAIVPMVRRSAHPDVLGLIAKGFGRIAWPFFGIAVFTGIWNMIAVDGDETTSGWSALLGFKMLLVVVAGLSAWVHQNTSKPAVRGIGAAIALLASLVAALFGVMLSA
jgi:putative copper export protein